MISLDNLSVIGKLDRSGMASIIASFPDQCRDAVKIGSLAGIPVKFIRRYRNIVCTGMGGSAIGADIARAYAAGEASTPIFVNRNYTLPAFVDSDSLVIVSSYSGNTEETISAFKDAVRRGARIIVITSGGTIRLLAGKRSIPVVNIPSGLPPRSALGYSFFTLILVLSRIGVIGDMKRDIGSAISNLEKLDRMSLGIAVPEEDNIAKKIARAIYSKIPVIYSNAEHMDAVSTRWRGQLAENSKTLASSNAFPELTHNEIVGWEYPKKLMRGMAVIMLRDSGDNPRIAKRMDIVKKAVSGLGTGVVDVNSEGKGLLARIFSLIYIGDYVSLYLAVLNKCDPTPVDRIVYLKKEMAKR